MNNKKGTQEIQNIQCMQNNCVTFLSFLRVKNEYYRALDVRKLTSLAIINIFVSNFETIHPYYGQVEIGLA